MALIEVLGYCGALLTLATFSMKTMVRLRMVGLAANVAFMSYGALASAYPVLILHMVLFPLNAWRLHQLRRLTQQIHAATRGEVSMDWLRPYSRQRQVRAGETLFRQGDLATEVLVVLGGTFRAVEANVVIGQGQVFGELGLVLKGNRRSQTVVCEQPGVLLVITYEEVRQLYFQNPKFGFYFLELATERLAQDAARAASLAAEQIASAGLQVRDTGTPKGRGVFASRAFLAGEIAETCPVMLLSGKASSFPVELRRSLFSWEVLAGVPRVQALALGNGSLYNHDNPANLRYEADAERQVIRFIAARDIAAGEELTINYNAQGGAPVSEDDSWFRAAGVELYRADVQEAEA